ncbi:MAG TPA: hypothetical protein VIF81_13360 [Pyrinomonadaceae bacterium]|jgi:hypothetical protein
MKSVECRHARREIDEVELGQLLSDRANVHLRSCPACSEFRAERTALRELVGSLEPVAAPADFDMKLRARIAAEKSVPRQPFFARLLTTPALAAAALFVIVAASAVWIAQKQLNSPVATNNPPVANNSDVKTGSPATTRESNPTTDVTAPVAPPDEIAEAGRNTGIRRPRTTRSARSEDFNVLPANSLRQNESDAYVPTRPVEFALQDERGNTRRISLPAVSFGAQSLVDNRTVASYSPNSRVW